MNQNVHTYLLADARRALEANHLLSALQSLQGMANTLKAWNEVEQINALIEAYRMMLSYLTNGADDPQRARMYEEFVRQAAELCDVLERMGDMQREVAYDAIAWRTFQQLMGADFSLVAFLHSPQANGRNLFDALWLSSRLTGGEEIALSDFLADEAVNNESKCLALSGMTLSGMRYFDVAKLRILLDYVLSPDVQLRVRALVGLIFVHQAHAQRLKYYPDLVARLRLMADVPGFVRELEMLQAQLFLTLETKRIERNLQEEIIPQMMARMKDLRLDRSLGVDELKDKLTEADLNPEWEADGTPSKLAAHMKEFMDLQQRGADMYMSTFKLLKQRFPFFSVAANWFWPFSLDHPDIPAEAKKNSTLHFILKSAGLCDSDKYSFAMMSTQLPPQMNGINLRDMMASVTGQEQPEAFEALATPSAPEFKEVLRSYVQGFYRFCNLYTHREAFVNPFQGNLFLVDYPPFDELLHDTDFLLRMADLAFKDKTYALAKSLLERVPAAEVTPDALQKLGFCLEQLGDTERAATTYQWANDLKPHSAWTLRRLAMCHRALGLYAEALTAYDELATFAPEDAGLALRQAECHIYLKQYDEAFKYLFKANYLDADSEQATRALAWCSLLTGKYEQAEKYYAQVLAKDDVTPTDWLNAGHTAWLGGRVAEAVSRYRKALPEESPEDFLKEDAALLQEAGKTVDDLALMTDAVMLDLM